MSCRSKNADLIESYSRNLYDLYKMSGQGYKYLYLLVIGAYTMKLNMVSLVYSRGPIISLLLYFVYVILYEIYKCFVGSDLDMMLRFFFTNSIDIRLFVSGDKFE